ncbi:uncharacterized protein LOC107268977 [Cephus cinctus]|uniref:Uncharacterized protein LOC107268977 n=1 Tax=Cephus cinctus TaxID=211228 RepID=A0AAJ7BZ23_CEPCN|nr:uncharacterized protein LOC107268977 [Cephus cinctus]
MDFSGLSFFTNLTFTVLLGFFLVPGLLFCYPVVRWSRRSWIRFVKWRHPNSIVVEENSVRSILDQGRNQGIYTLMLQGNSITEGLRSHLLHLSSTKSLLRAALTQKWGLYAWETVDDFSVDNHLFNSPCSFKGRPITESNLQEYVSDITSKFLPSNQSPWQVYTVNYLLNGEECKLCLVRVHHILLRQEHLTLADFLPLKYFPGTWACQENTNSPFTNLYAEPSALPRLHQKLTESFSNYWNEFLCNNDPTERPEMLKMQIGIFQCLKIGIIVWVSTVKEITRCYKKVEGFKITNSIWILQREASKRNFGIGVIFWSLMKSLNPIEIFWNVVYFFWYLGITLSLKTPILIFREYRALQSSQKHHYPDTLTSLLSCYLPLIFQATLEILSIAGIAIAAPRIILDELFLKHAQSNKLQTTSLCGRKVVAWSDEVDSEIVRKISIVTGVSEAEILLAATVGSLKEYFRQSGQETPQDVFATAKFVSQRALFVQNHEVRGLVCLALPTRTPLFDDDLIETLQVIQKNIQHARSSQSAIYAITAAETSSGLVSYCLPSVLLKVLLNHLTRRYSLSLTHVDGDLPVEGVDSAVFWRPPQGNCSMSITLHRYGKGVRLGVMADAMIGPQHSIITKTFPRSLQSLANIVGVPRTPSRSPSPDQSSPTTSPGY